MTRRAQHTCQAGRRGPNVRSDCWVGITPRESGGIDLRVTSKVESMYGDSIRALLREELAALGVEHATVELEDAGALPFALMARVETAVRRLHSAHGTEASGSSRSERRGGPGAGAPSRSEGRGGGLFGAGDGFLPEQAPGAPRSTTHDRFRRSRLYLPGNEPKFMLNAGLHGPDGVILDLEDSVSPAEKDAARILVRNALRAVDFCEAERMVRINQGESGLADLDFVVPHNIHVLLIPKVEDPEFVRAVDERVRAILEHADTSPVVKTRKRGANVASAPRALHSSRTTKREGRSSAADEFVILQIEQPEPTVFLMPIIESALGAIRAYEIATASPRVCALTIGLEDYTADIGAARTAEGRESFWARSQVVNAARAAGIQPIDSVFSDVADMAGLRQSVLEAKALGFEGKGCIHPRQIAVVHEAFAPTPEELENARRIVAAFEQAAAQGLGVVSLGSKMIDAPVVKRAQRTVRLAEAVKGVGSLF